MHIFELGVGVVDCVCVLCFSSSSFLGVFVNIIPSGYVFHPHPFWVCLSFSHHYQGGIDSLHIATIANDMISMNPGTILSNTLPPPWGAYWELLPKGQYFLNITCPRVENIDNVPTMMQKFPMQTLADRQNVSTLDVPSRQNLNYINKILYKQF